MSTIIPLHFTLRDFGKEADMVIANKSVTPPTKHTLAELVSGALIITNMALKRLPDPQELMLQQQWLQEAQRMILTNRR